MRVIAMLPAALLLLVPTASALDLVEMKSGKLYEAKQVRVLDGRLRITLNKRSDQRLVFSVSMEKVVPEFVYYAWAKDIKPGDTDEHDKLGQWARKHGLFRLALAQYILAAERNASRETELPQLKATLVEEEATWLFEEAWRLLRAEQPVQARVLAERLVKEFPKSAEVPRTKELVKIIAEREKFLAEEQRQKAMERRAKGQRRVISRVVSRVDRADDIALKARFSRLQDAQRRLDYAAYTYRNAALTLSDLLLAAELNDVKTTIRALLDDLEPRLERSFMRLGDLLYIAGDSPGALEAAHEVLAINPKNAAARELRSRILDDGPAAGRRAPEPEYTYPVPYYGYRSIGLYYGYGRRYYGRRIGVHGGVRRSGRLR